MTPQEQAIHDNAVAFAKANKRQRCAALTDPSIYLPEKNPVSVFMAIYVAALKSASAEQNKVVERHRACA